MRVMVVMVVLLVVVVVVVVVAVIGLQVIFAKYSEEERFCRDIPRVEG